MAKRNKPKFSPGQVVKHRIAGGFYMKIIRFQGIVGDFPAWIVMEQGKFTTYWDWQLRPLTDLESRGRKRKKVSP